MKTPLYSKLLEYSNSRAARFHMPGHKGNALYGGLWHDITAIDVTELAQTGDLFREESGAIRESESMLAETYRAKAAMFLTGGSTQGIFAMLAAESAPGDTVLTDRLCHYSAANAMALLDLRPKYIYRDIVNGYPAPLTASDIETALTPDIKTVLITSPSYNGVCSDLKGIFEVCEKHGARLLLDAAHGAHLPFIPGFGGYFHYHSAVMSAHKTLPALGQSAFLLTNTDISPLRRAAMITGSSSPSFPLMASIDLARAFLDEHGIEQGERLYNAVKKHGGDYFLPSGDPLRITSAGGNFGGIVPEMSGTDMAVFIISIYDEPSAAAHLFSTLRERNIKPYEGASLRLPQAKTAMTPRAAMFSHPKVLLSVKDAVGRVAAEPVAPFPPGVALLMPGEILEEQHLSYIKGCYHFTQ